MSVVAPPPAARPRRHPFRAAVIWLLLPLGVAVGVVGARALSPSPAPAAPPAAPAAEAEPTSVHFAPNRWEAAGVKTEAVAASPLADHAWRTGRVAVDDDRVAHISPPVEGVVREVRVRLGEDVAAGQVLAVIDSKEVGQAKLDLVTARVALAAEREREAWARTTAANTEALLTAITAGKTAAEIDAAFKDRPVGDRRQQLMAAYTTRNLLRTQTEADKASAGVIPGITREKNETALAAAEAGFQALREELRFQARQQARAADLKLQEAAAAHDVARTRLLTLGYSPAQVDAMDPVREGPAAARFEITAPFAGTVVEKHAVRSERVTAQFQLFQVADLSAVWVQADAFEADLPLLRGLGGRGLVFRAPAAGVGERPAAVLYAGDLVDRASRAVTVTATAANLDRALKPGMYVEVGLPRGTAAPVVHVPAAAVQRYQGAAFVFVLHGADEFRRADVELGREAGDRMEVTAGLRPGDVIAVAGGFVLKSELYRDQLAGD
ncbi:efflux RND transporter periplasmic adaptor subunit [bacterium]|nr:efflux RND transporter periplasmic adaptor subunit [bacterium]